jgi:hypothetical protein
MRQGVVRLVSGSCVNVSTASWLSFLAQLPGSASWLSFLAQLPGSAPIHTDFTKCNFADTGKKFYTPIVRAMSIVNGESANGVDLPYRRT